MKGARTVREVAVSLRSATLTPPYHHHRPRLHLSTRCFSSTPLAQQKRKPKFKSLSQEEMDKIKAEAAKAHPAYTPAEKAALGALYSQEQLAAIDIGEEAISAEDLLGQGTIRADLLQPQYLDDFSRIEPVIDKKIEKIRGEAQDYEHAVAPFHVPTMEDDLATIGDLKLDDEHVGQWVTKLDKDGNDVWTYEGREHELDYFAEKLFKQTPECREMLRRVFEPMGRTPGALPDVRDVEANYREEDELAALLEADESGAELEEAAAAEAAGEGKASDADMDGRFLDSEPSLELSVDYASHPKYQEIRARLEARGPMRRKYGFGSTPPQRELERHVQGVEPDVAPDIPRIEDPSAVWSAANMGSAAVSGSVPDTYGLDEEALEAYQRVCRNLGIPVADAVQLRTKRLVRRTVSNQTRLGKVPSEYVLCVAGNGDGLAGLGEGKAADSESAARIAKLDAVRNMVPLLRYENRTTYGDVSGKSGATIVHLSARPPGSGVRANAHIFHIARAAGFHDLGGSVPRARTPMNVCKAAFQALRSQRDPEDVARGRGKKLVDVRRVYYAGLV